MGKGASKGLWESDMCDGQTGCFALILYCVQLFISSQSLPAMIPSLNPFSSLGTSLSTWTSEQQRKPTNKTSPHSLTI